MTRKDYELIAGVLANLDEIVDEDTLFIIKHQFVNALAQDNPRFNQTRFLMYTVSEKHHEEVQKIWA